MSGKGLIVAILVVAVVGLAVVGAFILGDASVAEEPRIAASKLAKSLDRRWDDWFEAGLDPLGGFASAAEALEAFPTRSSTSESGARVGAVKVVIGRVRSALRQST